MKHRHVEHRNGGQADSLRSPALCSRGRIIMEELKMPIPTIDLSKASQKELIEEIKTLRQFVGLMLLRLKGYVEGQELSNALEQRMASFEKESWSFLAMLKHFESEQQSIVARLDILEKKVVLYEPK